MRAVLLIIIVAVIAIIAAMATGFLNVSQIRNAEAPQVTASSNGVTARGGQAPAFDIETGSVKVGSTEAQVKVPSLVVEKPPRNQSAAATNNSQ
jgi:hypothetical protein